MSNLDYIDYDEANHEFLTNLSKRIHEHGSGHNVKELLAMGPDTDPFYVGLKGRRIKATWFASIWALLGLDALTQNGNKVHLRRIHYLLVSRSSEMPPTTWGGTPGRYRNTDECWDDLKTAASAARYHGLVPFWGIEDNRNAAPYLYAPGERGDGPDPTVSLEHDYGCYAYIPDELMADNEWPQFKLTGYANAQRFHLEVWMEKSTANDVLLPLCRRYGINLMYAQGDLSITQLYRAAWRIVKSGRPARIFYISDFDVRGYGMPVAAGRKLEWFLHSPDSPMAGDAARYRFNGNDVTLMPIALTAEQVDEYDLPRQPMKEQGGKKQFEEQHGTGGVELDALEALYPGELAKIVSEAAAPYYDLELADRVKEAKAEVEERLQEEKQAILDKYQDEIEALEAEYSAIRNEAMPRMVDVARRMNLIVDRVRYEMREVTETLDINEEYPVPEADEAVEDQDAALLWSDRSYDEQLRAFKEHQGKLSDLEAA